MTFKIEAGKLYLNRRGDVCGPFELQPHLGVDGKGGRIWRNLSGQSGRDLHWENGTQNYLIESPLDLVSELSEDTGSEPPDYLFQRDNDI